MALLGALEHGIYVEKDSDDDDECHGMSIVKIHQYFGLDKDGSDVEMPVSVEEEEQAENVGNIGVEDLISDDNLEDWLACFLGSHPEEWDEDGYPPVEHIPHGRRQGIKKIFLPHHIWYPRAILWGQALYVLNALEYESQ